MFEKPNISTLMEIFEVAFSVLSWRAWAWVVALFNVFRGCVVFLGHAGLDGSKRLSTRTQGQNRRETQEKNNGQYAGAMMQDSKRE